MSCTVSAPKPQSLVSPPKALLTASNWVKSSREAQQAITTPSIGAGCAGCWFLIKQVCQAALGLMCQKEHLESLWHESVLTLIPCSSSFKNPKQPNSSHRKHQNQTPTNPTYSFAHPPLPQHHQVTPPTALPVQLSDGSSCGVPFTQMPARGRVISLSYYKSYTFLYPNASPAGAGSFWGNQSRTCNT